MKYKVVFKGGAASNEVIERVVDAWVVQNADGMTRLIGGGERNPIIELMVPNDRLISVEKIG